jgi:hypothetical protein
MKWLDGICAKVGRSDCWKSKVRSKFLNVTFLKSSLPPPPLPTLPIPPTLLHNSKLYIVSNSITRNLKPFVNARDFYWQRLHCKWRAAWWKSNINVWLRFMYHQKWNCSAPLFPKQNFNVLSPNFHIHVSVRDLYIPGLLCLFQRAK